MSVLPRAAAFVARWEGFLSAPYWDAAGGVWTIGYGHTLNVTSATRPVSKAKALVLLARDLRYASRSVAELVKVRITRHQRVALISFVFNLGPGALASSTLLQLLNQRKYAAASDEFKRWDKAGGQVLLGLQRRRASEARLFRRP